MEQKIYFSNTLLNYEQSDEKFTLTGYAAHFGEANMNHERVNASSFAQCLKDRSEGRHNIVVNYNHLPEVYGGVDEISTDSTGLYITAHLNTGIPFVRDNLIPNILAGDIKSFSTEGACPNGYEDIVYDEKDDTYFVKNFYLFAVAVTPHPADWKSEFSVANVFKMFEKERLENGTDASKTVKWYWFV